MAMTGQAKDTFICHTSADKESVARPLADRLEKAGITCWIDEREIRWGDSLIGRVNEGLKNSRYVIVILSSEFLNRHWPERELMAALNLEASSGEAKVLPLLAGSAQERRTIAEQYPLLNDKLHMRWPEDIDRLVADITVLLGREASRGEQLSGAQGYAEEIPMPTVRRPITQLERDRFARNSYQEIRHYFERALQKLKATDSALEVNIQDVTAQTFVCKVYASGEILGQCKIWQGGASYHESNALFLSHSHTSMETDSYNESLSLSRAQLAWEPLMLGFCREEMKNKPLDSGVEAAKYLWQRFINTFP